MEQQLKEILMKIEDCIDEVDESLSQKNRSEDFYPLLVGRMIGYMFILQDRLKKMVRQAA